MLYFLNVKPKPDTTRLLECSAALIAEDCFSESAQTGKLERGHGVPTRASADGSRSARDRHCDAGSGFVMVGSDLCLRPLGFGVVAQ